MHESVTHPARPPQQTVEVRRVDTPAMLRRFVDLPYTMHASEPCWVPPLRRDELRRFDPAHNAFLAHATITLWLAERYGQVVGRVAAIDDRLHNERHGERTTWFGFFEAADAEAAGALLEQVETFARQQGSACLRGPANPSLNESAGLLIDGFDADPYVLMPHNPPSYAAYVEGAGYAKAKDLYAWDIDLTSPVPDRIARLAERVRKRHALSVRVADLRNFEREVDLLGDIYRSAWDGNWGFVPPTDEEMRQLAMEFRPVVDPALVLFVEMDGRPVACAVTLPDLNQVLKRMRGRLLPWGLVHFLRRRRIVTRTRMLLLGVVADAQRLGLYPLLIAESYRRAAARGYVRGEVGWTLEDNDVVNAGIEAVGGRRYKTYRLYEKSIG